MNEARRFTDRFGFTWQVCELTSQPEKAPPPGAFAIRADASPTAAGWLYFFSRGTTLVLRDYPREWGDGSWGELEALRERAQLLGSDTMIRIMRFASPGGSGHAHGRGVVEGKADQPA